MREQSPGNDSLATAHTLVIAVQCAFDTLRFLASQLQTDPTLFATRDPALHQAVEDQVGRIVRLLEGATAEIAVPKGLLLSESVR